MNNMFHVMVFLGKLIVKTRPSHFFVCLIFHWSKWNILVWRTCMFRELRRFSKLWFTLLKVMEGTTWMLGFCYNSVCESFVFLNFSLNEIKNLKKHFSILFEFIMLCNYEFLNILFYVSVNHIVPSCCVYEGQ